MQRRAPEPSSARTAAEAKSPGLAKLDAGRHKLIHLQVESGDTMKVTFASEGARAGSYKLRVQIHENLYRKLLVSDDETLELPAGTYEEVWQIDNKAIGLAYLSRVLNNNQGDVEIEEPFTIGVGLEPILTEEEQAALSPRERERLASGALDLMNWMRGDYTARFLIKR
jgi:hypothetical protein